MPFALTPALASHLARIALGHVEREFPHKPGLVLTGPDELLRPSAQHPVFYGSFDWHSCVHSYWLLARLLRTVPALAERAAIEALFARNLTAAKLGGEHRTMARPAAAGFERPYGWGWLLALEAELRLASVPDWAAAIAPLAGLVRARWKAFLTVAPGPVRAGTHGNTALALRLSGAGQAGAGLEALAAAAARFFGSDRECPAWDEPGGEDFLSPALIEAECMRFLLPDAFAGWLDGFLPRLARGEPAALFRPVIATDRRDGKIAHLDGLNLSRAWCMRSLARALPPGDARVRVLNEAAEAHIGSSLPHLQTDYMGEHWLATYALLALAGND